MRGRDGADDITATAGSVPDERSAAVEERFVMVHAVRSRCAVACIALLIALPACRLVKSGTWSRGTPLPAARYAAVGAVVGGKLFIIGGYGDRALNSVSVYNSSSDIWETRASMPTARYSAGAAVMEDRIYVVGGIDAANRTLGTVEIYDPATDAWTVKQPMHDARFAPSIGAINGRLHVAGGGRSNAENPGVPRSTTEIYDPGSDVWTRSDKAMPVALYDSAYGVIDGKLFIAGGWDGSGKTGVLEVYDPASDTWSLRKPMTCARQVPGFGVIKGKLYVAGGWDRDTNSNMVSVEVYDPGSDTWTTKPPLQRARQQLIGGSGAGGRLHLVGGYDEGPLTMNDLLYTEWRILLFRKQ
jgi:N-acetylneuraminic acid mutarotase